MIKYQKGFLIQSRGLVVTDKSLVNDVDDSDFIEIQIAIKMSDITDWAEEIDMLGLDEEF